MVETKLQRIAEKSRKDSGCRFTSLFHLMNNEMLRECFRRLRKDAAAGIDEVTKVECGGPQKLDNVLSYRSLTIQGDDHEQKEKAA